MKKIPKRILSGLLCCAVALGLTAYLGVVFSSARKAEPIYPGPGVTEKKMLSDYYDGLKGTAGDTEVYVLDSGVPGASMLVLGGTHPNEPSGVVAAVSLIETCQPTSGVLYVIPRANNSAFSCTDPGEAAPMTYSVETAGGDRWFRFGSRATNPIDQWPDNETYVLEQFGQTLSGSETRNLNRAYPGKTDGTLTEKVTYGIRSMIDAESIDITVDLHEASPEYTTVDAIVAHQRALELANLTLWGVEDSFEISVEASPTNLHGLSHRELGDFTDTLALLMETANASQGRLHGVIDSDLVVSGKDKFYKRADEYGALTVDYSDGAISLTERCARHITCLVQFCENYEGENGASISLGDMPSFEDMMENGIGAYLASPQEESND